MIERNEVSGCDFGLEVGCEHSGVYASGIIVRENFIHRSFHAGLATGGYSKRVGGVRSCAFTNNTLSENDTSASRMGELLIQNDVVDCAFRQNIFVAGRENLLIANPFTAGSGNTFDYNLYFAPAGAAAARWQWKNVTSTGFAEYRKSTGKDAHSIFADPELLAQGDPHLSSASPAINAGDPEFHAASGERDIDGAARIVGERVDIGADEFASQDAAAGDVDETLVAVP